MWRTNVKRLAMRTAASRSLPTFETRPLRGARAALPWWSNPALPALRHLPGRSVDGSMRPKSAVCQRASAGNNNWNGKKDAEVRTRDHVVDIAGFAEPRQFAEISEGIPHIVESAAELEGASEQLFAAKDFRASDIVKGHAEEEAAKVLILLDSVRCPRKAKVKAKVLKGFYTHFVKRIYAKANSLPNILSFGEMADFVEDKRRPFYLDGPSGVDWIFPNAITADREQKMYVDYVRDITEPRGDYSWYAPMVPPVAFGSYRAPRVVSLSRALCDAGVSSADGLACVGEIWREFQPDRGTSRAELRELIQGTLIRLDEVGSGSIGREAESLILSEWSFPLWLLDLTVRPSPDGSLEELRRRRQRTIEWIEATESRRDPPPAINRDKVAALSGAYRAWRKEVEERLAGRDSSTGRKPRVRTLSDIGADRNLASYGRMKEMFTELSDSERTALLALAWFTRDVVADWPRVHGEAIASYPTLDEVYQLGLGRDWMAGFARWEQGPEKFAPGRW